MNNESEAIEQFLAWLLQETSPIVSTPSGKCPNSGTGLESSSTANVQFDSLLAEDLGEGPSAYSDASHISFQANQSFEPGDIPAVQDRFHSLLKRRLQAEIERNPPLFPWEAEVYEYETEVADVAATQFWGSHLRSLNLPVPLPDATLTRLLEQCQQVVHSSLREGAKLVQAVESLFPGNNAALNQLAGMVMAAPARSGLTLGQRSVANANFPSYEEATPAQQMVLSLLAAKEILANLTLEVSAAQPRCDRQWTTSAGTLTLTAEYLPQLNQLRVQAQLPCAGTIRVQSGEAQTTAQRSTAGNLGVEVLDLTLNQAYPVEVYLNGMEDTPLIFTVLPSADS